MISIQLYSNVRVEDSLHRFSTSHMNDRESSRPRQPRPARTTLHTAFSTFHIHQDLTNKNRKPRNPPSLCVSTIACLLACCTHGCNLSPACTLPRPSLPPSPSPSPVRYTTSHAVIRRPVIVCDQKCMRCACVRACMRVCVFPTTRVGGRRDRQCRQM